MTYEKLIELTKAGIEIWKTISGYEGCYEISNFGKIRSIERDVNRNNHTIHIKGKIKKPHIGGSGYYYTVLCKEGKCKLELVHRLLANAFIPNPENKPEIDHINADRSDYRLENLRWATHKENNNNANTLQNKRNNTYTPEVIKRGIETRKKLGSANAAKTVYQYTKDGAFVSEYYSMEEAKRITKAGHICEVLDDNTKTSGGFLWTSKRTSNLKFVTTTRPNAKAIQQFDMKDNLIGEWDSITKAAKETGLNINTISRNIKALHPTKYRFKYKEGV